MSEHLHEYYALLYPYESLTNWLTYSGSTVLSHREFSFEYEGKIVERYISFKNSELMKKQMTNWDRVPLKVDAGAIWNQTPEKDSNGYTLERQLIFDFDMNDYDDVRTCCQGKNVCKLCWRWLVVAIQILNKALLQDFGFSKILYVFSGGRGLHLWVCDKRARLLKDSVRHAIVTYFALVSGNTKGKSMLTENVLPVVDDTYLLKMQKKSKQQIKQYFLDHWCSHHLQRSLEVLHKYAHQIFQSQKIFQSTKGRTLILNILKQKYVPLQQTVQLKWNNSMDNNSNTMWNILVKEITKYQYTVNQYPKIEIEEGAKMKKITFIEEEILLSVLYPRMDFNVSTSQNHLLKLPFSVHAGSKRISVPIPKADIQTFNPQDCITLKKLLQELKTMQASEKSIDGLSNQKIAKLTSLVRPIRCLQQFTKDMTI